MNTVDPMDNCTGGGRTDLLDDRLRFGFFVCLAALILVAFRDYGWAWDEVWQGRWYGQAVLDFITSAGVDRAAVSKANFYHYGGLFDALAELFCKVSPLAPRDSRHLMNAFAGLMAVAGCWQVAGKVGGQRAAFWSALFLVSCAPFWGHLFVNNKDIPFAAGYIWSLYYLLRINDNWTAVSLRDRLLFGLCCGMTLGVRVGGVLLLGYYLLLLLGRTLAARGGASDAPPGAVIRSGLLNLTLILPIAYGLMLLFWPAALLSPLAVPYRALLVTSHFSWPATVLWNGRVLWADQLPWNYLPLLWAVQLPAALVVLGVVALPWTAVRMVMGFRRGDRVQSSELGVLMVAALFPPLWAVVNGSVMYDNGRHFLFVLPPLAVLCGTCWSVWLGWLTERIVVVRWLLPAGLLLALLPAWSGMYTLHPYEYTYFNRFAGGMPAAAKNFDTDYWIVSYREAVQKLVAHAQKVAEAKGVPFSDLRFSVMAVAPSTSTVEGLPENMELLPLDLTKRADYLIATTRWGMEKKWPDWQIVAKVERAGMVYSVVKCAPELAALVSP